MRNLSILSFIIFPHSVGIIKFLNHSDPEQPFLLVGTAKDYILSPRHVERGYIYVYR